MTLAYVLAFVAPLLSTRDLSIIAIVLAVVVLVIVLFRWRL